MSRRARRDYGASPTPGEHHASPTEYELTPRDPVDDVTDEAFAPAAAPPTPSEPPSSIPSPPSPSTASPAQPRAVPATGRPAAQEAVSAWAAQQDPRPAMTPAAIAVVTASIVGLVTILVTASIFAIRGDGERDPSATSDPGTSVGQASPGATRPGAAIAGSGLIEDGAWDVGDDVAPGVYRALDISASDYCFWSVVAEDSAFSTTGYVEGGIPTAALAEGDEFESFGCGTWTGVDPDELFDEDLEQASFAEGAWLVGEDIAPGVYRAQSAVPDDSAWGCALELSDGIGGGYEALVFYEVVDGGRPVLDLARGQFLVVDSECGTWDPIDPATLFDEVDAAEDFGDGYWLVGEDIAPGTYVTTQALPVEDGYSCAWSTYDGVSLAYEAWIDWGYLDSGQATVTLERGQLITSSWCGTWEIAP